MNVTRCVLAVFSPTGGTQKIAQAVGKGTGLPVRTVDLCQNADACTIGPEELLVAACPVFGGRIPAVAGERLARLQGAGGPAIAVAVYGNRAYDDALLELKYELTAGRFTVCAAGAFIAEHSMVREVAAGRPDAKDAAAAQEFGEKVVQKVRQAASLSSVEVPGSPAYKEKKAAGAAPKAGKKCVACGQCAAVCPVGAIPPAAPNTTTDACIGCMRCVAVCPQNARDLAAPMKLAVKTFLKASAGKPKQPEMFL